MVVTSCAGTAVIIIRRVQYQHRVQTLVFQVEYRFLETDNIHWIIYILKGSLQHLNKHHTTNNNLQAVLCFLQTILHQKLMLFLNFHKFNKTSVHVNDMIYVKESLQQLNNKDF